MTHPLRLLATGAFAAVLAGTASAQLQGNGIDFSSNWHTNRDSGSVGVAISGNALFSALAPTGTTHPGVGDSIRRCFGIDDTQGGRNQSTGNVETTWIGTGQGFAPGNAPPFQIVDVGLASVVSYADTDVNQDICLNPFADLITGGGTSGQALNAAAVIGQVAGTGGLAFPTVFELVFQWVGSGTLSQGPASPATVGDFSAIGDPDKRLPYLVFEVQGPVNGGPANDQYYLGATTESTANTLNAMGGITNGNPSFGYTLFGSTADQSAANMGTRFTAFDNVGGYLTVSSNQIFLTPAPQSLEFLGRVATQTPALWATRDGQDGGGGPDWIASTAPTSVVNLRYLDTLGGAQATAQIGSHKGGVTAGGGTPPPTSVFDPTLVLNIAFFLWSASSATTHPQSPTSWDDLGGLLAMSSPGSVVLGPSSTLREGLQTIPIVFDALTAGILAVAPLSAGTPSTPSDDLFELPYFTTGGAIANAAFEGSFSEIVSGVSGLPGGPVSIFGAPDPSLRGARLGIAALGIQLRIGGPGGPSLGVAEVANGLTLTLQ